MVRINPDIIELKITENYIDYEEYLKTTEKNRDEKIKQVKGGIALLWERLKNNDQIDINSSIIIEKDNMVGSKVKLKQNHKKSISAVIRELTHYLYEISPKEAANSILPVANKIKEEKNYEGK